MKTEILRCVNCCEYTLKARCPRCDSKCLSTKPAKFSPEDKYGYYRRLAKKNVMEN